MTAQELIDALDAKIKSSVNTPTEIKIRHNNKGYNGQINQGGVGTTVVEAGDLIEALKQLLGA